MQLQSLMSRSFIFHRFQIQLSSRSTYLRSVSRFCLFVDLTWNLLYRRNLLQAGSNATTYFVSSTKKKRKRTVQQCAASSLIIDCLHGSTELRKLRRVAILRTRGRFLRRIANSAETIISVNESYANEQLSLDCMSLTSNYMIHR